MEHIAKLFMIVEKCSPWCPLICSLYLLHIFSCWNPEQNSTWRSILLGAGKRIQRELPEKWSDRKKLPSDNPTCITYTHAKRLKRTKLTRWQATNVQGKDTTCSIWLHTVPPSPEWLFWSSLFMDTNDLVPSQKVSQKSLCGLVIPEGLAQAS